MIDLVVGEEKSKDDDDDERLRRERVLWEEKSAKFRLTLEDPHSPPARSSKSGLRSLSNQ